MYEVKTSLMWDYQYGFYDISYSRTTMGKSDLEDTLEIWEGFRRTCRSRFQMKTFILWLLDETIETEKVPLDKMCITD